LIGIEPTRWAARTKKNKGGVSLASGVSAVEKLKLTGKKWDR